MTMQRSNLTKDQLVSSDENRHGMVTHVESTGPWPFISRHLLVRTDGMRVILRSRHHRKGLHEAAKVARLLHCLWMPGELNWWIGSVFALGASLFMLGSILVLLPALASAWALDTNAVNMIFFTGSIPFTTAAYLQLFQAANAGAFSSQGNQPPRRTLLFGWRPHEIGWLSCALQFAGTLLFNVNTFDAMLPGLNWLQQDLKIWVPNFAGSILFLASGHLAFAETCHAHWAWKPGSLSWWVTFINYLGCVAFMISAVFAFVPPWSPHFDVLTISVLFTLIGAACFLVGSLLMLPETAMGTNSDNNATGGSEC